MLRQPERFKSEICALEKVRGVLYKLKGLEVFITDCEVAEGSENKRSESCGGGFLVKTKSVMIHPANGMACPPLELACNTMRDARAKCCTMSRASKLQQDMGEAKVRRPAPHSGVVRTRVRARRWAAWR